MDLRGQLSVVRSWLPVIVLAAVLAAVAAYLVSMSGVLPKTYEARALINVQAASSNPNVDSIQTAQRLADTYAEIAKTDDFARQVLEQLGATKMSVNEFHSKVSVAADPQNPFITISATDTVPATAAAIAQGMADELLATAHGISGESGPISQEVIEQLLNTVEGQLQATSSRINTLEANPRRTLADEAQLRTLTGDLVTLSQTYAGILSLKSPATNRLTIVDRPVTPGENENTSPRPLLNTLVSAVLGLLVATGVAFVWEKLDDRVRTPDDVERVAGLPTIGTVIRMPSERGRKEFYRLATLLYPRSVAAEAFRTIRTNLEFASLDRGLRTLTVTSALSTEGKSVVSANLAVAFAQSGKRTILVDADLRRPGVHELFAVPNAVGLTDMMLSDAVDIRLVAKQTDEPNLRIITSGTVPANPAELLGSQRMAAILQRLLAEADLVVLDTPPVAAVTDAALVAARSDATLLVVNPDRSSERMVRRAGEALAHVNARVVGVVLNNVSARDAEANPYYGVARGRERDRARRASPAGTSGDGATESTVGG